MKPFLASPNETIEAASQNLKLKMASVERDTKLSQTQKKCRGAKKKISQWMCPPTLLQMLGTTEVYVSIKFHSSTSEARDSLRASSCQNQRSYTVFFYIHVATEEVQSLVSRIIIFSEAWIGFNEFPPFPQYQCWYKHKREKIERAGVRSI